MKERVKELMGKTLDKKFSHTWTVMDYRDLEKFSDYFAELIIRESISIVQSYRCKMDASNDNIVEALKQNFGVEW